MIRKLILASSIIASNFTLFSQQKQPTLIPCNTYEVMEELFEKDPNARARYNLVQSQLELDRNQDASNQKTQRSLAVPVYTVPVVFHVLHQNGSENIPDADIQTAINQINSDFAKMGSDASTIHSSFASLYIDAEIRFVLAKRDPNGNCTNGIIRHLDVNTNWDQTNPSYSYSGSGAGKWATNKYLNVYIVKCISSPSSPCPAVGSFIGGYTYLPGSWGVNGAADAIVYRSDLLTNGNARSLSHEIGHWLNLQHTFGATNNPGVSCGNDGLADTPPTKGFFSSCPGNNAGPYSGCATVENMENFMDYSSCPKMFTSNQVGAMRSALVSANGGRNNLITVSTQTSTGVTGNAVCAPVADFTSNQLRACVNATVNYTSKSLLGNSGSISWIFQGGTPATSTSSNPSVSYATAGTYSVSITATNSNGSNTKSQTAYITVTNGSFGTTIPNTIDFESGIPSNVSVVNNNVASVSWISNTSTGGATTAKSIYLPASSNTGGHLDVFETPYYNLSNVSAVSLSYYYAYAKKISTQADTFRIQYSLNCGGTWSNILTVPNLNNMAAASGGTTSANFVPTSAQWKQTIINSAFLTNLNNKPSVKLRFYFKSDITAGSSNNFYIDQINLSGTVGLNELEIQLNLSIYPNPTNGSATLNLITTKNDRINVSVHDILGRTIEVITNPIINGTNLEYSLNSSGNLSKGIYMIAIDVNEARISKKLIIE